MRIYFAVRNENIKYKDMEKQVILVSEHGITKRTMEVIKKISNKLSIPAQMLHKYYSYVLQREVSKTQAKAITEAQLAFFAVILPADYPLTLRILACVWFVVAVKKLSTHPTTPQGRELD